MVRRRRITSKRFSSSRPTNPLVVAELMDLLLVELLAFCGQVVPLAVDEEGEDKLDGGDEEDKEEVDEEDNDDDREEAEEAAAATAAAEANVEAAVADGCCCSVIIVMFQTE